MLSPDAPLSEVNRKGLEVRISLLREMLAFCNDRGLRPVVVMPPMHEALADLFTDAFVENYIRSFVHEAAGGCCEYYDYMRDDRFRKEEYFANAFFMNEMGARAFTECLMKNIGIIQ